MYLRTLIRNTIQRHVSDKQTATVVFQGKRMREKAKDMIAKGLSKAQWRNPQDDTSMLYIYVVPTGEINDDYLSDFTSFFNFIRDESGNYGIFPDIRLEDNRIY